VVIQAGGDGAVVGEQVTSRGGEGRDEGGGMGRGNESGEEGRGALVGVQPGERGREGDRAGGVVGDVTQARRGRGEGGEGGGEGGWDGSGDGRSRGVELTLGLADEGASSPSLEVARVRACAR
jgi:hypothetical protein